MRSGSNRRKRAVRARRVAAGALVVASGRLVLVVCVLAGVVFAVAVGSARAESLCTDTWTGPSEGLWTTASDWSSGSVPTSSDVACIGAGKLVDVAEGANQVGVVQGEGGLEVAGGVLEVSSALETSTLRSLTVRSGGVLTGAATVAVSGSFVWKGTSGGPYSTLSGSGKTVIESGASAVLEREALHLEGRVLVNEGTMTWERAEIVMFETAELENKGLLRDHGLFGSGIFAFGESPASLVNTGTFEKTGEEPVSSISVPFINRGAVQVAAGELALEDGGVGEGAGCAWSPSSGAAVTFARGSFTMAGCSWSGAINITSATVATENVTTSAVQLTMPGGVISVGGSLSVNSLSLSGGEVLGGGTLTIAHSLSWSGSSGPMAGSGTTVLAGGATATLTNDRMFLDGKRRFVNEGTMTLVGAELLMAEEAVFENNGKFNDNSEFGANIGLAQQGGSPSFVNNGAFDKEEGEGTVTVGVDFTNNGSVSEGKGHIVFQQPKEVSSETQFGGSSLPNRPCPKCGDPVVVATGDLVETQNGPFGRWARGGPEPHADLQLTGRGQRRERHLWLWLVELVH